jgi:hydroxyacylglutathione hydrolase
MIQVKTFFAHNNLRNFSYLIFDPTTNESWIIDPYDELPIIDYIKKQGLNLKGILNTHHHWDHVRGNKALVELFHCPELSLDLKGVELGGNHYLRFLSTPGHTLDHCAFLWEKNHRPLALFSGDTLFNSGVGNCKNGGDVDLLYETTLKLSSLPDDVLLYPGHDYRRKNLEFAQFVEAENPQILQALEEVPSNEASINHVWSLGRERQINPFLRLDSEEIRQKLLQTRMSLAGHVPDGRDLFKHLRSLRDNW